MFSITIFKIFSYEVMEIKIYFSFVFSHASIALSIALYNILLKSTDDTFIFSEMFNFTSYFIPKAIAFLFSIFRIVSKTKLPVREIEVCLRTILFISSTYFSAASWLPAISISLISVICFRISCLNIYSSFSFSSRIL